MIDSIAWKSFVTKRTSTFTIATGSVDAAENVIVKVVSGDEYGIGNASPSNVTQETLQSIEGFLAATPKKLAGTDETDLLKLHQRLDAIAPGNTAAKAGIDIAVFDLLSKRDRKPLYEYLGGSRDRMMTDMTIGIEPKEITVKKALLHYKAGFRALKLKVGFDLEDDIRRVAAVREAVGPRVELRVDANQGYTVEKAIRFSEALAPYDIAVIEQPVPADDYAGLKAVTEASTIPIMADECVKSVLDARKVAREGDADMINIKLMKSAGIIDAVMINRLAESTDMNTMVGCMGEIQVSIAAGLHFALSSGNVKFADLDSHFSLLDDPSSGLKCSEGYLIAPNLTGLGIATPLDGPR